MKENRILTLILMICMITSIFFLSRVLPQQEKQTTMASPVEEALSLEMEGIVVRKEYVYYAPASGQFTIAQEEGQKVRRGAPMGVFTWDERNSMEAIQAQYKEKIFALTTFDNIRIDLGKIRSQVNEANETFVDGYRLAMQCGDFSAALGSVEAYQKQYDELFSKQNASVIQMEKIKRTHRELEKMKNGEIDYRAPIAGIVSYVFDDYEEDFLYENVRNDLERAYRYIHDPFFAQSVSKEREWLQPIYRLSDNSAWYVLIRLSDETSDFFRESKQFVLSSDECLVPVRATKSMVSQTEDGEYWLLEVEERFYEINDVRHLTMQLRPARIPEGVAVPKEAISIRNGETGVWRLRLNQEVVWTPVVIVDENRNDVIVQSVEPEQLRAYDEVEIQEGRRGQEN